MGRRLTWGGAIAAVGAAAIALSPAPLAFAGEGGGFTVNSTADAHDFNTADPFCDSNPVQAGSQCTLRAGIEQTNAQPGPDRLIVPKGTYGLNPAFSNLQVSDQLVIDGARASNTILRPTGPGIRILQVNGGARLHLSDATVRDGVLGADGGGILNDGSLTLRRSVVRNNQAFGEHGGGIYSSPGAALTILDSVIGGPSQSHGNVAAQGGGGIESLGTLVVRDSTIAGNALDATMVLDEGAGIHAFGPTTVVRTTISGNGGSDTREGGGLHMNGSGSTLLKVSDSTISGNAANVLGAGLMVRDADAAATNLTVSGNTSTLANGANAAVFAQDAALSLQFTTIAGNPQQEGATLRLFSSSGTEQVSVDLKATIIDSDGVPVCVRNGAGTETLTNAGYSVFDDTATCGALGPGDVIAPSRLRALADNGGPTRTRALKASSRARNRVARSACPGPAKDQRGVKRPQGRRCDAGAYELARCAGVIVNRVGTNGRDRLRGTGKRDGFLLGGGKDRANGKRGKDALCGGGGRDRLNGGPGRDVLNGGPGRDVCRGGPGKDKLRSCERGS